MRTHFFAITGALGSQSWASQGALVVRNLPANAGDTSNLDLISGSGRFPGEGNGKPLQYSWLGNPMGRRAWWATVHGIAKESDTAYRLNNSNR